MKKLFLYLAVLMLCFYPSNSFAGSADQRDDFPKLKHLKKELNLTDKQQDEILKIRSEHQKKMVDLRADLQKVRIDIKDQMKETNLNEEKILSLTAKASELQAKIKETSVNMWLKSYNLLDDKQKEVWKKYSPLMSGDNDGFKGKMKHFKDHCLRRF